MPPTHLGSTTGPAAMGLGVRDQGRDRDREIGEGREKRMRLERGIL